MRRLALIVALLGCAESQEGVLPAPSSAIDTSTDDDTGYSFVTEDDVTAEADTEAGCEGCLDLLCAPCTDDSACGEGGRCLPFGGAGRFCGRPCTEAQPCPSDFKCSAVSFRDDVPGQCMPISGTCTCTPDAIAAGASTECKVTSPFGECPGTRSCAATGLTSCEGQTPGPELCNGTDDDCDGETDEGLPLGEPCGGACTPTAKLVCAADGKGTVCSAPPREPVPETCDNTDDDCDGQTDEGCDDDGDEVCDATMTLTGLPEVCKKGGGDCNDDAVSVHPGLKERCETEADDNCNGDSNELGAVGCVPFWFDADGDGAGGPGEPSCYCESPAKEWVAVPGDCDDVLPGIGPLSPEVCGNGIDDNCDGNTDEDGGVGCFARYPDADGDGVGALASPICTCNAELPGVAEGTGDCDDENELVRPGLPEACDNLDNDCDGDTDGYTEACPSGCGEGTRTCVAGVLSGCDAEAPECTEGPCCDGCHFKSAAVRCGDTPLATRQSCVGSCGGSVLEERQWAYCSGSSAQCGTDNPVWEVWGTTANCSDLCVQSGNSAQCTACPLGCANGACNTVVTHTICIDAGYGGSQPGPVNGALQGKDITLAIAKKLQTLLVADTAKTAGGGAWKVVMTRSTDVDKSVDERVAACAGAERVVSIMANACGCTTATGMETYTVISPSPTTADLAAKLQAQAVAQAGIKDRGVKAKDWALLTGTAAPGSQTYVGFVDGSVDAPLLASDAWRQKVALGLLYGLQLHFGYASYTP